jgi:anti-sigma factor RsiW
MNHAEIQEKLSEFYDGRLPPQARQEIETHLPQCTDCRQLLAGWQQVSGAFLKPLEAQASDVFVQNVMRKVRAYEPEEASLGWPRFLRWAAPALALSMAGFTIALSVSLQSDSPASETEVVLQEDEETSFATEWLSSAPDDDQILDSMGVNV